MEKAILITVDFSKKDAWSAQERSAELNDLSRSAGAQVIREEIVHRRSPTPAYFIGEGKASEIAQWFVRENLDLVIFNNDLTPTQQKNLEDIIGVKTVDRTQLILDIFARRARSNEGKIQVELAQLLYFLPRLTGKGILLSRLGGGIGTRGPGEQKLEVDRRRIRDRITRLKRYLEDLGMRRAMMRKHRERFASLTIAIIGYTNVGKSTLLNSLTRSEVVTEDELFSTLDPTVRKFVLDNKQKVLFVDTVGFLNNLPHHLIEAFRATLEEVKEADLLLHLIDISHPKAMEQGEAVYRVLEEIGAMGRPIIPALNKIDKLENSVAVDSLIETFGNAVPISALKKQGLEELMDRISLQLKGLMTTVRLKVPTQNMKLLNLIYENGVVREKTYKEGHIIIKAEIPIKIKEYLAKHM